MMKSDEFRKKRAKLGFSRREMGEQLGGYTARTVEAWENNENGIPQAVEKLTNILILCKEQNR